MDKRMMKEVKKEAMKAIKIVRKSEKRQGIVGYKIFNTEKNSYLTFNENPSIKTIEYTKNFEEAHYS